ncbi:MAG: hypothetical protein KF901_01980 [Myxococcales bacterium]|nr:hypothetical protein [Myxococcales bacterium]
MNRVWILCALASLALGCKTEADRRAERPSHAASVSGGERPDDDRGRCEGEGPGFEVSEYDTSGDDWPDVRKVFRTVGEGRMARLILICREADLNGDGIKDVVRFYNDEGRPMREEADRNFDGQMDELTFFERGHIVRQEIDTTGDGRIDTKIFFENGRPVRGERDLSGRSTAQRWTPDTWEYYEEGRLVRVGVDVNGDGRVDRWDRDAEWQRQREAEAARREAEEAAAAEADAET